MPDELAGPVIGQLSAVLKVDPNAPLNPNQVRAAQAYLQRQKGGQPAAPPPEPAVVAEVSPVAARTAPLDAAPVASGDMATADRLDLAAAGLRARAAATANLNPKGSEGLLKQADAYGDRAKQIREQVGTSNQPTPSIKEWRQSGSKLPYDDWVSGAEGAKETAKQDANLNAKKYEAIVENGTKAQNEIPQLQLLQEQMNNDPNFFSGSGEKYNLLYKRLKSAVGIDPDAPVPQELLRKVTASNVLSSLGALKGLGPIRVAEMNMAKEAAASPDNSIPANKMLVEISKRTHQRNAEIADMAQAYKEANVSLDTGFDKKVSQFYKDRPMFSDAEIKDWHKVSGDPGMAKSAQTREARAPNAPMQTFASPADVRAANLPRGTKFKDANGVERVVP
jgi:hypothetical protein